MIITPNIKTMFDDVADRYVPAGIDSVLHLDKREAMKILGMKMLEAGVVAPTPIAITIFCKNWEVLLYQRAIYLN